MSLRHAGGGDLGRAPLFCQWFAREVGGRAVLTAFLRGQLLSIGIETGRVRFVRWRAFVGIFRGWVQLTVWVGGRRGQSQLARTDIGRRWWARENWGRC